MALKVSFKYSVKYLLRLIIRCLFLVRYRQKVEISDYTIFLLRHNLKLHNLSKIIVEFLDCWDFSNTLFEYGWYKSAINLRSELLTKIHLDSEHSSKSNWFYSYEFGTNIGHVAVLGVHQDSQRKGLLPFEFNKLPVQENNPLLQLLNMISPSLDILSFKQTPYWTEIPTNSRRTEKFQSFCNGDGYVDQYGFLEHYFQTQSISKLNRTVTLPDDYLRKAQSVLAEMGLKLGCKFVSLHIREGVGEDKRRSQSPETFLQTLKTLSDGGYWILRIGDPTMSRIEGISNFIDLSVDSSLSWLHPFALYHSTFHLGTNSGPSILAQVFGTPALVTNTTSIARCTLFGSKNTLYLPKKIQKNGRELTLREILLDPEGYSELNSEQLDSNSTVYIPNTSDEINDATLELIDLLESKPLSLETKKFDSHVDRIRKDCAAITYGRFCQSFLKENEWFLV